MVRLVRLAKQLLLLGCCFSHGTYLQAEDWYRWRGPSLNGISNETDWSSDWPQDGPTKAWQREVGVGFSSMVISSKRLYTLGNVDDMDTVYCLDALTGIELWKYSYSAPLDDHFFEGGPTSTPTVDGEYLYTLSRQGDLFCFDKVGGAIRWTKSIAKVAHVRVPGWGFAGSPVVHGELLLLNVGSSGAALNKSTGEVVWMSADGEAGYMTPLPIRHQDRPQVLIASGKQYSAADIETGKVRWQHRWLTTFGCNAADPIEKDGRIFISSGYNRGSALLDLTAGSPQVVWTSKELQNQFSSSVLIGEHLFGVDGNDTAERSLKCVEFATGRVLWQYEGLGSASLMAAGDRLVILGDSGELVIARASPHKFEELARAKVLSGKCWTVPVHSGDRIYCRSVAGEIVCLDVRKKSR